MDGLKPCHSSELEREGLAMLVYSGTYARMYQYRGKTAVSELPAFEYKGWRVLRAADIGLDD